MGDISLSFTEQRNKHRTELSVHHELHNALHRDTCDNYFLEIINALKVRLPESHAKKVTILQTLCDEMLPRYNIMMALFIDSHEIRYFIPSTA